MFGSVERSVEGRRRRMRTRDRDLRSLGHQRFPLVLKNIQYELGVQMLHNTRVRRIQTNSVDQLGTVVR